MGKTAHLLSVNLLLRKLDLPPLVRGSLHCEYAQQKSTHCIYGTAVAWHRLLLLRKQWCPETCSDSHAAGGTVVGSGTHQIVEDCSAEVTILQQQQDKEASGMVTTTPVHTDKMFA